jgi:serine/threonine protein kinase
LSEVISDPGTPGDETRQVDWSIGARLGTSMRVVGYRIEERLGRGGMAEVFRALDENLGRQVALKVLAPELASDPAFRHRFVRESRAAAAVDHPNIIPIYDAGDADGLLFIAMRYVRGGDVKSLLARTGRLGHEQATDIITAVASALDAANAHGLVHRDVKPANMLLDSRPDKTSHVYLTDFGITVLAEAGRNTDPGFIAGTFDYMAPEQIEGRHVDGRTDQYGLACSAFEMLSGFPPFYTKQAAAKMTAQLSEPPPALASRRPDLPPAVDDVLARALSKNMASRFASCTQFAEELGAALSGRRGDAREATALGRSLDVAIKPSFRYIHEPSRADDDAFLSLGNNRIMAELESRIRHSRDGTFLITGFRGVGKSTLVLRALDHLIVGGGPDDMVLPVILSVARSTSTERLLFAIVRRVFETLSDSGALSRLPPRTRHALLVAYMRTSLSFKETQSDDRERSAGFNVGLGPGKLVKAVADFGPSVSLSAKRSQSLATEASFLAYSETDVEYDLMRIVSLLDQQADSPPRRSSWRRIGRWRSGPRALRLHLIIVLDEVDKLTGGEAGLAAVEDLLGGIKNVLTTSGAHFLIVAGPDLHDRSVRDIARGNGVYESVFGWRLYVPCIWDAPDRLVTDIVADDAVLPAGMRDLLVNYLRFKARGVPRRLLQEVNGFIGWNDDRPRLKIGPRDMERVEFYARLERILRGHIEGSRRRRLFPVAIDEDRWRLGGYYVVDWVLQSEGTPFTASDLIREGEDAEFDPLLRISRRNVERLLDHLSKHQIVEVVREMNASATVFGDVAGSADRAYRLTDEIRQLLYGLAAQHESERADREVSLAVPSAPGMAGPDSADVPPWNETVYRAPQTVVYRAPKEAPAANVAPAAAYPGQAPPADTGTGFSAFSVLALPPARVINQRYELGELVSQGGISSSYKGRDLVTGRPVVVKLLLPALSSDQVALARFRREAEIVMQLDHPHILRTLAVVDDPATTDHALIQEWLNGQTLEDVIDVDGPMPPAEVAGVGRVLADALSYLAGKQIVRLDLKPGNILMVDRGPVIIDLGIATPLDADTAITAEGQFIGTPAFVAPERLEGSPSDERADIYTLGLVLYYCLAGKLPWDDKANVMKIIYAVLNEPIDLADLPVSPEFRSALGTALARAPHERFGDARSFRRALSDTPEWRSVQADQV